MKITVTWKKIAAKRRIFFDDLFDQFSPRSGEFFFEDVLVNFRREAAKIFGTQIEK